MTTAISRLHICPFTPDLLRAILPPSIKSAAQNISYHQIQTCPESSYGYVDLPVMEAEKIKKKLNGAILRGKKIKIEEARPQKRRRNEVEVEEVTQQPTETEQNTTPKPKKPKRDPRVIPGHELSPKRKIKRGWTEVKPEKSKRSSRDKGDRPSSKYSEKEELLFRTIVPPNKVEKKTKSEKKQKKATDGRIVHEFEKSTIQPSFLRDGDVDGAKQSQSYIHGKGWVSADGEVVEQEHGRTLRQRRADTKQASAVNKPKQMEDPAIEENPDTSESESGNDSEVKPNDDDTALTWQLSQPNQAETAEDTSSSGTSESDSASDSETYSAQLNSSPRIAATTDEAPPGYPDSQPDVHPLEALFKKPSNPASQDVAKPSLEVQTSFSFFNANEKADIDDEPVMPGTPFSSQDLRGRDHRSAAPTPDTAYPSRFNSYGSTMSEKLGAEKEDETPRGTRSRGKAVAKVAQGESAEPSDFEKMFWEKRGDNNRAWKQKRRETLKEKRQKENRARKGRSW